MLPENPPMRPHKRTNEVPIPRKFVGNVGTPTANAIVTPDITFKKTMKLITIKLNSAKIFSATHVTAEIISQTPEKK